MASLSYYLANQLVEQVHGGVAYSPPATLYYALSSTTPQKDGTNVTEPSDPAYARVSVANNLVSWGAGALGSNTNLIDLQFPEATQNQGVLTHWVCYDALTGGNMLASDELVYPRTVEIETVVTIPAGRINNTFE